MEKREPVTNKPLQRISWNAKKANGYAYFKDTADYYIRRAGAFSGKEDIQEAYDLYNNKYNKKYFKHVMDPLSAKKKEHQNFAAKMRPTGILRTNLDLLMGEYPRRPFVWQVTNLGEDGYNSYTENLSKGLESNLTQHFIAAAQQQAQASGVPHEQIPQPDEIQLPEAFQQKFKSSYKDNMAIKGQKWMERAIAENRIREEQFKMFKDYLISGYVHSYKAVERNKLVYERVSPKELFYDQNDGNQYLEDKEWVVRRRMRNLSDVVDNYYDELKESELQYMETSTYSSREDMYNHFRSFTDIASNELVTEYHIVWKGKKQMGRLYYPDPDTGEVQMEEVDGDYVANKDLGERVEKFWCNEVYETVRLNDSIYLRMRPVPVQRNEMDSLSECKLPYNGRAFSDTESENISVQSIGLPFQLMHMIINFILEKTIAKSKGKIFMIDKNAIPREKGWDEEKFFYYADALGYALIDRNQAGVDRSMNQYSVVDMTLFDSIAQLITLQEQIKQQWDDILGITRQRKGQTYASDSVTNNQAATFQSTVITDTIYSGFEEFVKLDFQGILDFSRFTNASGVRRLYNNDDFGTELLDIDPTEYTNASLGVMFMSSVKQQEIMDEFKGNIQAMVQNGTKNSTILDIIRITSVAELGQKLRQIEDIESQLAQQSEQAEQQHQMELAQKQSDMVKDNEAFINDLKVQFMNLEYDRKDQNAVITAQAAADNAPPEAGPDVNNPVPVDPNEMAKRVNETMKALGEDRRAREVQAQENQRQNKELIYKYHELEVKKEMSDDKNRTALKNKVAGQK